ncbi:MAG: GAF domain-containing protein [Spirulinaceae cyanobacterium SM2_1_0]|nr:GAF domain-containing protein [Spirulinaceae cyanobacterium SM2_1_0]
MSDHDLTPAELAAELTALRQEVSELRKVKNAFDAQNELVRSLVSMGRAATGRLMMRSMLLQTVKLTSELVAAQEGSLFMLDADGYVTESILARGATVRDQRENLIGKVLDQGLAGWVVRHRRIGLIEDTRRDERWMTLPNQPYTVGSAICIPILRGKSLLGVLTLTHHDTYHFTPEIAYLLETCAVQMALALDNARLYVLEHQQQEQQKSAPDAAAEPIERHLADLGIYIIAENGRFLYANPRVAEIFGYEFGELVGLESMLKLVATTHFSAMGDRIQQCFQGSNPILDYQFQGQRKDRRLVEVAIYGTRTKFYGKYVLIGMMSLA